MPDTLTRSYPNIIQSFGLAGINVLVMLIVSPVMFFLREITGKEAAMLLFYSIGMGLSFLIAYSIRKRKTGISSFPIHPVNIRTIALVVLTTLALLFGIIGPLGSFIPMSESFKKSLLEFGAHHGVLAFITMVIAAPVVEELIFRGIILDGLLRKYTALKSILISSLIFGLVHLNPWQFIAGLIIGIFAGWVYYRTRSLSASIIIHMAANLAGFAIRFFVDANSLDSKQGIEYYGNLTNFIAVVIAALATIASCVWYLRKEFSRKQTVGIA
jgi:membrane protease YdiL (CAAX protease family)